MTTVPKLIILSEQFRGQTFELTDNVHTIGRGEQESICIPDATVSGRHCEVVRNEDATYLVRDIGSTNGTRINGVRITEQQLSNSDILQVGGIEIMFDCEDQSPSSVFSTRTNIDLEETAGGIQVKKMTNFSPFDSGGKTGKHAKAKLLLGSVIGLLLMIVIILGAVLLKGLLMGNP